MSVDSSNNLIINDNLKVNHTDIRLKSPDGSKEIKLEVDNTGDLKFKDNNDKEIIKLKEGGRLDLAQNDTAESLSLTNW